MDKVICIILTKKSEPQFSRQTHDCGTTRATSRVRNCLNKLNRPETILTSDKTSQSIYVRIVKAVSKPDTVKFRLLRVFS